MTNRSAQEEVLVIGATGTVGAAVVRSAMAAGARVRALVRSDGAARSLPSGVTAVRGDLRDEASLARAVKGVRSAFYVSPHEPDEEELAERVVRATEAERARLVFVGVHIDGASRFTRALKRLAFGRVLAHYRPKFRLSERVRQTATNAVILMPTNFYQNDELFSGEIERGIYRIAFERPVNRVDVRDVGDAAARALLDDSLAGGAYPVVGPTSLTGSQCAATWSEVLGRPVEYQADEAGFRDALAHAVVGKKREDFVASFGVLRGYELRTDERELAATAALLGRAPTPYRDYVRSVAAARGERLAATG